MRKINLLVMMTALVGVSTVFLGCATTLIEEVKYATSKFVDLSTLENWGSHIENGIEQYHFGIFGSVPEDGVDVKTPFSEAIEQVYGISLPFGLSWTGDYPDKNNTIRLIIKPKIGMYEIFCTQDGKGYDLVVKDDKKLAQFVEIIHEFK